MRKLKHRWVDINKALHGPPSVFVLQAHLPDDAIEQWGSYTKDGNNISISSNCNITITKQELDVRETRKKMYGE